MSNDNKRYQVGDVFKATLVITDVEKYDDVPCYTLEIKGLPDADIDNCFTSEELDLAFNPTIIKRKLQDTIELATKQLEEMDNNE